MSTPKTDKSAAPTAVDAQALTLAELSEEARALALSRWQVLRPHMEDGAPLAPTARHAGVPLRTAQRWLMSYRADGLAGLARRQRADCGRRRVPDQLIAVIEGLALRSPAPTIATVHRRAVEVAERERWPVPSYAIVREIDPGMVTLAHEGDKRYRETHDLIYRREADAPNEIWHADHTELDLWVLDAANRPARPWLTIIEDDHSRAVAG